MDRLDTLVTFLAVAEAGGLSAAGRRLGRSPPAMSRALAELEARLGVRLADRSTRRFALTDAGRRLAEQARRALGDIEDALREAAGEGREARGRLRLAAPLVFGRRHVAPVVAMFLDAHPAVSVDLVLSDRVIDLVEEGLDLAVRIGRLPDSSLRRRHLGSLRRVLVASPAYLARRGTPSRPDDLAAHDLVVFASQAAPPSWRFAGGITLQPQARFAVNEAEAAVAAAVEGRGVLQALSYQPAAEIAAGRLVRLLREHEPPPIPVQLVHPAGRFMPARLRAFLDEAAPRLAALPVLREA
ncbi:LysR family transcriptional regulator [Falsiroseomonas sp. HW251]|uniref:LysR family transcriptional regulator n=1 Tax=Falsiroseomonas sp. HW251 TaxID=3390998 RepID=UPI003D30F7B9